MAHKSRSFGTRLAGRARGRAAATLHSLAVGSPPKPSNPAARGRADRRGRAAWWVLLALPPITVLVVGLSWLWAKTPSAWATARLVGGPTEGPGPFTGRVQLLEHDGAALRPLAESEVTIEAARGGEVTSWRGQSDWTGWAEVRLEVPVAPGPFDVRIFAGEQLAAQGPVELSAAVWRQGSRTSAGLAEGRSQGELQVRVRVTRGVLAASLPGELEVEVAQARSPAPGVELSWTAQGLTVLTPAPLRTDAEGRARLQVQARGQVATLELSAAGDRGSASWSGRLPIVAGAMTAEVIGDELVVRSPIERDSAWYTWVTPSARWGGGKLELAADPLGALGRAAVPPALFDAVAADEVWVVVSSEPDARSPSAVGWPAGAQRSTFDVPEALLLDGGVERERALMKRKVSSAVGIFVGLATLLTVLLFVRRVQADGARLRARIRARVPGEDGAADAARGGGKEHWRLVVAASCVALGVALAGLLGLLWTR